MKILDPVSRLVVGAVLEDAVDQVLQILGCMDGCSDAKNRQIKKSFVIITG